MDKNATIHSDADGLTIIITKIQRTKTRAVWILDVIGEGGNHYYQRLFGSKRDALQYADWFRSTWINRLPAR